MQKFKLKEGYWFWEPDYTIFDADRKDGHASYTVRKKMLAMVHSMEMKELPHPSDTFSAECSNDSGSNQQGKGNGNGEVVLTIRRKALSLGQVFEIVRNDKTVVAEVKEKRGWLKCRHVLQLADVEYEVDTGRWTKKQFSIRHKGNEIASVFKKSKLRDWSGSFWVDVKVEKAYYEGEALKDICSIVLAACIIIVEILINNDNEAKKREELKKRQDELPYESIQ